MSARASPTIRPGLEARNPRRGLRMCPVPLALKQRAVHTWLSTSPILHDRGADKRRSRTRAPAGFTPGFAGRELQCQRCVSSCSSTSAWASLSSSVSTFSGQRPMQTLSLPSCGSIGRCQYSTQPASCSSRTACHLRHPVLVDVALMRVEQFALRVLDPRLGVSPEAPVDPALAQDPVGLVPVVGHTRLSPLAVPRGFLDRLPCTPEPDPAQERHTIDGHLSVGRASAVSDRGSRVRAVRRGGRRRRPTHDCADGVHQAVVPRGRIRESGIGAVAADQAATHDRGHVERVHESLSLAVRAPACGEPHSTTRSTALLSTMLGTDTLRALLAKEHRRGP